MYGPPVPDSQAAIARRPRTHRRAELPSHAWAAVIPSAKVESSALGISITAWFIEPFDRRSARGSLGYVSREGAGALGDLALAPTMVLIRDVAQDQALAGAAAE
jgi:hypothetical protein